MIYDIIQFNQREALDLLSAMEKIEGLLVTAIGEDKNAEPMTLAQHDELAIAAAYVSTQARRISHHLRVIKLPAKDQSAEQRHENDQQNQ